MQRNSNVDTIPVVSPECISIMSKYTIEDCPGPKKEFASCLVSYGLPGRSKTTATTRYPLII